MKKIDFSKSDFGTLMDYVLNLKDAVFGIHKIGFADAIRQNTILSVDEKIKVFDAIESQSKIRWIDNPNGIVHFVRDWEGKGNELPEWCEANKAIIKAMAPSVATDTASSGMQSFTDAVATASSVVQHLTDAADKATSGMQSFTDAVATASSGMQPYLSANYNELYNCFNQKKVNQHYWSDFVEFIEKHRQGDAIDMARIAFLLKENKVLSNPKIPWARWYGDFCKCCGIAVNDTYKKDSKKALNIVEKVKELYDEMRQTSFFECKGGDALNHPHVGFNESHLYSNTNADDDNGDAIHNEVNDLFDENDGF